MFKKFRRWTGLKRPSEFEIQEERDKRMRSQYLHPIDALQQKMDQLFETINRVCILDTVDVNRFQFF
jgi:hypothetical protein